MVAHAFNPSVPVAEAGGYVSLRSAWSVYWVRSRTARATKKTLSQNKQKNTPNQIKQTNTKKTPMKLKHKSSSEVFFDAV